MFEFITSFFSTAAPPPPGPIVTVLIIPADGAPPRIERLATVNVRNDGRGNRFLHYVPDMRVYWGSGFGWECQDIARIDIKDHVVPALNGFYYGFKSFAAALPAHLSLKLKINYPASHEVGGAKGSQIHLVSPTYLNYCFLYIVNVYRRGLLIYITPSSSNICRIIPEATWCRRLPPTALARVPMLLLHVVRTPCRVFLTVKLLVEVHHWSGLALHRILPTIPILI